MFSCLQILEAFLWFVLITLLNVTLIILTLSVSRLLNLLLRLVFFFQAEDGIRVHCVTGVQTCALPILLGAEFPEIREMLSVFGSRQIRNRATLGGNLVTASPIGDSAPVLLALDASVVLASVAAERVLPLDEFFVAYRKTALRLGEILKSVVLPRPQADIQTHRRFFKVSKRREMDISTVAACFAVALDQRGIITKARLAYGGVAALPVRAKKTEAALLRKHWSDSNCEEVLPIIEDEFTPISDVRGSAVYRQKLIANLLRKFFADERQTMPNRNIARFLSPRPESSAHESAHKHVTAEAIYVDPVH